VLNWLNQLTLVGLLLLAGAGVAWRNVWFAYTSRGWPTAPARIDHLGLSRGGKYGDKYRLVARYSYSVNGTNYESTRNKPGRSCLVAGLDETTLGIAIMASVVGVTALVAGIR
jgi:Protein of unknown function (DUF3592)